MEELVITEEDHFKNLILSWSNKFQRQLEDTEVLIKEEKDGGYSRVVVDTSRPVKMKYSKKLEMFTLYLSYGPHSTVVENHDLLLPNHDSLFHKDSVLGLFSMQRAILPLYKVCKENMIPSIFNLFVSNLLDNVP